MINQSQTGQKWSGSFKNSLEFHQKLAILGFSVILLSVLSFLIYQDFSVLHHFHYGGWFMMRTTAVTMLSSIFPSSSFSGLGKQGLD